MLFYTVKSELKVKSVELLIQESLIQFFTPLTGFDTRIGTSCCRAALSLFSREVLPGVNTDNIALTVNADISIQTSALTVDIFIQRAVAANTFQNRLFQLSGSFRRRNCRLVNLNRINVSRNRRRINTQRNRGRLNRRQILNRNRRICRFNRGCYRRNMTADTTRNNRGLITVNMNCLLYTSDAADE